ncbi:MAG: dihydrodipicolinate synthase family protein [Nitrolancea sp.]
MITVDQAKQRWEGVLIPIVTPFDEDLGLNVAALKRNIQWLMDRGARQGSTVFLAAGSGGDFTSMNVAERKAVISAIAEVVDGRAPIIAGAQALDVRDTIEICKHCEGLNIDAVQISGAFYYDGRPDDVVAWMKTVASQTSVGFAIYNNWYTGYDMPMDLIDQLLEIPNSIGVKWSSPDAEIFLEGCHRFADRAAVVNNTFLTIPGHLVGLRTFVSHIANYQPEWCWQIWKLMESGQYRDAQQEFDRVMRPYRALVGKVARETGGEGVFVRPAMDAVGLEGGHSRLPSRDAAVSDEIKEGFRKLFASTSAQI